MQPATNEKSENNKWSGKNIANTAANEVASLKNVTLDDVKDKASDITDRVRDVSADLYKKSADVASKNPLATALGFAGFTFLLGLIAGRMRARS